MRHQDIWRSIDGLAARHALSPSGLARLAGLDPTAFNPSKRFAKDGRPRWPSTQSVAAALEAVGADVGALADLLGEPCSGGSLPLLKLSEAAALGCFDASGIPMGEAWRRLACGGPVEAGAYGLEITDSDMAPVYRPGECVLAIPGGRVREGDRVVARLLPGDLLVRELAEQAASHLVLRAFASDVTDRIAGPGAIDWIAPVRGVWQPVVPQ